MTNRIIVNNKSSIDDLWALMVVERVMHGGRISNCGKDYCSITTFGEPKVVVWARTTRTGTDTFTIYDDMEKNNVRE